MLARDFSCAIASDANYHSDETLNCIGSAGLVLRGRSCAKRSFQLFRTCKMLEKENFQLVTCTAIKNKN